jgi:hypothetical protein
MQGVVRPCARSTGLQPCARSTGLQPCARSAGAHRAGFQPRARSAGAHRAGLQPCARSAGAHRAGFSRGRVARGFSPACRVRGYYRYLGCGDRRICYTPSERR